MNKMKEESDLWHYYVRQAILTPFVRNVPLLLLLLLFICVFSNSTTTQNPPALSSSAASARRRWEIFASCSFFVHLHREVPNHARSEGSKCNPSKYNGANPHEQAPTDGSPHTSTIHLIQRSELRGSLKTHRFPQPVFSSYFQVNHKNVDFFGRQLIS